MTGAARLDAAYCGSTVVPSELMSAHTTEVVEAAREAGIDASFAVLVAGLTRSLGSNADIGELRAFLTESATEDLRRLVHLWILAFWTHVAEPELEREASSAIGGGEQIIALHRRVLDRAPVGRDDWRKARVAAMSRAPDLDVVRPVLTMADAVAAAAWDLEVIPAAIGDVVQIWFYVAMNKTKIIWSDEERLSLRNRYDQYYKDIESEFGPRKFGDPDDSGRRQEAFENRWRTDTDRLVVRARDEEDAKMKGLRDVREKGFGLLNLAAL